MGLSNNQLATFSIVVNLDKTYWGGEWSFPTTVWLRSASADILKKSSFGRFRIRFGKMGIIFKVDWCLPGGFYGMARYNNLASKQAGSIDWEIWKSV